MIRVKDDMTHILRRLSVLVFLLVFVIVYPTSGALYSPERESELLSRIEKLVDFHNHVIESLPADSIKARTVELIDSAMLHSPSQKYSAIARLVNNMFKLDLYAGIVKFMREDFRRKEWGKPFLTSIKFTVPMKQYVLKDIPSEDANFEPQGSVSLLSKVYEIKQGLKHFDQQFKTFIYRLADKNALMVVRGRYVMIDLDLNGIPDEVYFMRTYISKAKKKLSYLLPVAQGEDVLAETTYQFRYTDSLFLVLEYIIDNFPIRMDKQTQEVVEAKLRITP